MAFDAGGMSRRESDPKISVPDCSMGMSHDTNK